MRILLPLAALFAVLVLACVPAHAGCGMMRGTTGGFPPAMDPALLPDADSEGARLLKSYCTQCHGLPGPGLHTAQEWPAVVARMESRMRHTGHMGMMHGMHGMGMMRGVRAPSSQELDAITDYLAQHAQQPAGEALHEALETPAGETFHAICTQCHTLPDPKQHTAKEWSWVVERMKGHARSLGKRVPDDAQTRDILTFLRAHARAAE